MSNHKKQLTKCKSQFNIGLSTRLLLYALLFVSSSQYLKATHIVGGQIEARHISGKAYEVKLVLYFDAVNGNPKSKDTTIQIASFSKSNNQIIDLIDLKLRSDSAVPYTNPECQRGSIKTDKLVYLDTARFDNVLYNDAKGFYLVWERCCRNSSIKNIVSPENTGTVFYMELPPVTIAGFNSSPAFKPLIGDYGCVDRLFKLDFGATDADGDSLAYRLATPLAGYTSVDLPSGSPSTAPYRTINWMPGYSESQMIQGRLPLTIDARKGELQVIASVLGLYAFAVVCEEYRAKIRIGEVRREFQLPMVFCLVKPGPHIAFQNQDSTHRIDTIEFKSGTRFCTDIEVRDTVKNTPLNFSILYPKGISYASATVNPNSYTITDVTDTSTVSFCINGYLKGGEKPYLYQLVVKDDACSTPNTDTLSWYVHVKDTLEKPKPVIKTPLPDSGYVKPNEPVQIIVDIEIPPMNQIDSSCKSKIEVSVPGLGLSSNSQVSIEGQQVTINWVPDCKIAVDSTIHFKVFVSDEECITPYRDSVMVSLKVKDRDEAQNKPISNFISPNGDGINDDFAVSDYLVQTCKGGFEKIDIFNRWGAKVFQSEDYQFRWKAEYIPDGLYYFAIRYQSRWLNGYILVAR